MTEPVKNVYQALTEVMGIVQSVSKDQRVSGAGGYNFRGIDAVVNAVGPAMRQVGVICVPDTIESLREERYETKSGTKMHGVVIIIRWRIFGPGGDWIDVTSAGQASDSGDKAVPKAHSVALRTALLQALMIPTDDPDPDSEVHERGGQGQQQASSELADAIEAVKVAGEANGLDVPAVAKLYADSGKGDIRTADAAALREFISAKLTPVDPAPVAK